jgi:hypothetical protein
MIVTVFWDVEGGGVFDNIDLAPPSVMEVPDNVEYEKVADWLTDKTHFFVFDWKQVRY